MNTSELWKKLHTNALTYKDSKPNPYLTTFTNQVPRFNGRSGCKCQEFWVKWVKSNPPSYGAEDQYFNWTVNAHNAVNTKLGKKLLSYEEAKQLYQ